MRADKGLMAAAAVMLLVLLAGCGSVLEALPGGDKSEGGTIGPEVVVGTLSGVVQDGVVSGASINVYAWNGQKGDLLSSGTTDSRGRYSVQVRSPISLSLLIEATGGRYMEETTGQVVTLKDGQSIMALQNYTTGQVLTTPLTYYTTLATALAEHLVRVGMPVAEAVQSANDRIGGVLGFDITGTLPVDVSSPTAAAVSVTRGVEYGFATAAVSSFTEIASAQNGSRPHVTFNSIALMQAAYEDLRFDGLLDGRGESGVLFFGSIPLTTDVYRHEIALHILRAANTPASNQLDVPVAQLKPVALRLNNSEDPIFSGSRPIALDGETPNILSVTVGSGALSDGSVLFGSQTVVAAVATFAGAASAELLIDGVSVGQASDPNQPSFALDTLAMPDGSRRLTLRVVDIAGALGERSFDVVISNSRTTIANVSITDGSFLRGIQRVSAVINDPVGIRKIDYFIEQETPNGVLPILVGTQSDPRLAFDFDTTVIEESGPYAFVIAVTNNAGVTTRSAAIGVTIDNVPPTITFEKTFRSGDGFDVDPDGDNQDSYNGRFRIRVTAVDDLPISTALVAFVDGVRLPEDPDGRIFDVDTTQFTDGVKTLIAIATDRAGNQSSVMRQITFDNTGPRVSITSSTATVPLGGSFTVNYSVEEANFDEGFFIIWGDGAGPCRQGSVTLGVSMLTVRPSECQNRPGIIRIAVSALDQLGNRSGAEVVVTVQ